MMTTSEPYSPGQMTDMLIREMQLREEHNRRAIMRDNQKIKNRTGLRRKKVLDNVSNISSITGKTLKEYNIDTNNPTEVIAFLCNSKGNIILN